MKQKSKQAPKHRRSGKADFLRQLARGLLTKQRGHKLSLTELKRYLEDMLQMELRQDYLLNTLSLDPRMAASYRGGKFVITAETVASAVKPPRGEFSMKRSKEHLTVEEFVARAIETLQNKKFPGKIHTVFSGFNEAFRAYFPKLDPVKEVQKLAAAGKVALRPCRGGALMAKGKGKAAEDEHSAATALKKMGLTK